jgi:hypothetical protein
MSGIVAEETQNDDDEEIEGQNASQLVTEGAAAILAQPGEHRESTLK